MIPRFRGAGLCALAGLVACEAPPPDRERSGDLASDYIGPDRAPLLEMEMDHVEGFLPNESSRRWVRAATQDLLDMPDAVRLVTDDSWPSSAPEGGYTRDDILALEAAHRDQRSSPDVAVMYVLFVDGRYHTDTDEAATLGLAYGGSSVVIFQERLRTLCQAYRRRLTDPVMQQAACPLATATTWIHEVGHLVGLVGRGTVMVQDHLDREHEPHDTDPTCIMHWLNNTPDMFPILEARLLQGQRDVQPFCARCGADLAAARKGEAP